MLLTGLGRGRLDVNLAAILFGEVLQHADHQLRWSIRNATR